MPEPQLMGIIHIHIIVIASYTCHLTPWQHFLAIVKWVIANSLPSLTMLHEFLTFIPSQTIMQLTNSILIY